LVCMGEINSYKVSIKRWLNAAEGTREKKILGVKRIFRFRVCSGLS